MMMMMVEVMMMASEKSLRLVVWCWCWLVHPWGQSWIVVFPWGWILLHRHSGRDGGHGDDNIVYDDDFNDPRIVHYISLDWIRLHRHCGPGYDWLLCCL